MILPDVNVLVHAFRSDSSDHRLCRGWLNSVVAGNSRYGISPQVLAGMIRVVTHPRIFRHPSGLGECKAFCERLTAPPQCALIYPGAEHFRMFLAMCEQADARGNLVSDAWYAALAIEAGCEWITLDRDYARFPGLKWGTPK
ncbi:MAG: type II toxin-antitoxin system VapC family toxin [Acidobacteria bacterium]|nr:type II toxin-antitoxin system VapC family toxin [Acidobacteriota bacterium]